MVLINAGAIESGSQIHRILSGTVFMMGANIAACSAIIYSVFVLNPKISNRRVIPLAVFMVLNALIVLVWGILRGGMATYGEWVAETLPVKISFGIIAGMGFVPSLLFLAYGANARGFSQKLGGFTLSAGFLILGYFAFLSDIFGIAPELIVRRIGVAVGMVFVYLGFFTPHWYLDLAKKLAPKR